MRDIIRAVAFGILAMSCGPRPAGPVEPDEPASEPGPPKTTSPALAVSNASCTYGGAVPGYSVMLDATAPVQVIGLRATSFEIESEGTGAYAGASVGEPQVRRWSGESGSGDILPFDGGLAAGEQTHLQLFGQLDVGAFGEGATYPTEARAFKATLEWEGGSVVVQGSCEVTPAG